MEDKRASELTVAELKEALKPMAQEIVAGYVKEAGLDKVDQKHIIVPEDHVQKTTKEQLELTPKERFGLLMKALWRKDYVTARTQSDLILKASDPNNMTTDVDGGYLVPDQTAAEILRLIPTLGQARQYVNVGTFPRSVDNWTIPKESTGFTIYYPGEQGSITSTKLALTYITLVAKKAAAIGILTNELRDFASVDFVNYMQTRAAEAFAIDEDTQVFGTGNTYFTGLFYTANTYGKRVQVADTNSITYKDISEAIYGIDQAYLSGASWFMHRTILDKVRNILDGMQRPIFHEANGGTPATLMGYPIRLIERCPTSATTTAATPLMLLGNLQHSLLKDKQGMRIDFSGEATVDSDSMFQEDQTAIRFIRHWSFHPNWLTAYSVIALNS